MTRPRWHVRGAVLDPNQGTVIMGVVNATPDSFSDGGRCLSEDSAVALGLRMWRQGAHIVDVGGESTRPGAAEVSEEEELGRVVGVVARLASAGVLVSIDTSKPGVAEAAIDAGAAVLNDITALEDPEMARVCASAGVGVVLMHMRGNPRTMQVDPYYADVVTEVGEYLRGRIGVATAAGVDRHAIAVDPGIGFGKTLYHNLALLNGLPVLAGLGRPVLVGASRKAFLGALTHRSVEERDSVTAVASGIGAMLGASVMRVHDVPSTRDALALADAMVATMEESDADRK
ncbi:MAG: dihydropteroate synthase [Acidimicrobiia bacterium]|nr:dihydropteroate synthase [Acidimicrobiia bacterium]